MLSRLPPALLALAIQLVAVLLAMAVGRLAGLALSPFTFALLCGALAATLSHLAGLARWWLLIQMSFVPGLVGMLSLDIPPAVYLLLFTVLLVVYWNTFRTQVPLYLSSRPVWQALAEKLPTHPFSFVDLGCGLGGVLTWLARSKPYGRYYGVEAAPLPFLWSWLRIRLGGYHNCSVQWHSLWDCDLSAHDVVYAYLSPVPMGKLWEKARREMKPGSLFISNTFEVPGQPPDEILQVNDLHRSCLYCWRM
ncbi:MAG: hypothetical protein Fur0040_07410 [Sideroxydans sp.]